MKILYIHQYFSTPQGTGGTRSYWIAQELLKRGHHVTMLTAGKENKRANVDGIDVLYVKNPAYSNYQSAPAYHWLYCYEAQKEQGLALCVRGARSMARVPHTDWRCEEQTGYLVSASSGTPHL